MKNTSPTVEEIREHQREIWNKFSSGWKQWDNFVMHFLRPVGEELIQSVALRDDYLVLDVATGTGEPGMTAASIVKRGKVIGTDLSEKMIAVARENAATRKISNYTPVICDAGQLPFHDDYFDAAMARFGFMFFPDMLLCAKEMCRVLKKTRKISTSVWSGPEQNPWASIIIGIVNKMVGVEPPPPDMPGLFRCAKTGFMPDIFYKSGFINISEKEISGTLDFENPEQYWNFMTSVAAPVVSGLSKADETMQRKIKETVLDLAAKNYSDAGRISFQWTARIITGEK